MNRRRFLLNGTVTIMAPIAMASCEQSPKAVSTNPEGENKNQADAGFELSENSIDRGDAFVGLKPEAGPGFVQCGAKRLQRQRSTICPDEMIRSQ